MIQEKISFLSSSVLIYDRKTENIPLLKKIILVIVPARMVPISRSWKTSFKEYGGAAGNTTDTLRDSPKKQGRPFHRGALAAGVALPRDLPAGQEVRTTSH